MRLSLARLRRRKRPRLSVSVQARNAADALPTVVADAREIADEVIIGVDASSVDGTFGVAADLADVVYRFAHDEWVGLEGGMQPSTVLVTGGACYKTATQRPWTITGASEYPTPARFAEGVVGWRASRARVHEIGTELESGIEARWAR